MSRLPGAAESNPVLRLLDDVDGQLETAIDSLLAMSFDAMNFPVSLDLAARLLRDVRVNSGARRAQLEPRLQQLAAKTVAARQLLDSAAAIHLGWAGVGGATEAGYLQNGATGTYGSDGSLWVQG